MNIGDLHDIESEYDIVSLSIGVRWNDNVPYHKRINVSKNLFIGVLMPQLPDEDMGFHVCRRILYFGSGVNS
jgi:hypothetical protein